MAVFLFLLFYFFRCDQGYSGERCHLFSLEVKQNDGAYNRTTALAVVAVVLSSLCLLIIGLLLALRFVFNLLLYFFFFYISNKMSAVYHNVNLCIIQVSQARCI